MLQKYCKLSQNENTADDTKDFNDITENTSLERPSSTQLASSIFYPLDQSPSYDEQLSIPSERLGETSLQAMRQLDDEFGMEEPTDEGTSSMRMAFMNMANSILGAGIIGQPYAMKNSGLLGGIVVMIILTIVIDWTLRLIVINAEKSQTRSYQDTVQYCYGYFGKAILLLNISFFAYGGCMAFCVIIGDTIPHVLRLFLSYEAYKASSFLGWLLKRNVIIVLFISCISYPLSLNRDISRLAKASGFALLGMTIIIVITLCRGPIADVSLKTPPTKSEWLVNKKIFQGISVISFALVCHHNTMFIYNSMRNSSVKKFSKLTHIACSVSVCLCLLMGIPGLLNFGDNVKGNILNNFKANNFWVNIARFCFGLNMLTTFPLEVFVVRDVLKEVVVSFSSGNTGRSELSRTQHFIVTTFLVFSSMSVSLFTCNLGMILELIGATSASLMAYIIPPLCYLKLCWDEFDYQRAPKSEKKDFLIKKALPSVLCALFGFAVMSISSFLTVQTSFAGGGSDGRCVDD